MMFPHLDLTDPHILAYIKTIGYPTMLLLMIIEGPIVSILGAFLAKLGFFNVYLVLLLSILGDLIGDVILYSIGFYGGERALAKAEKILKIKPAIVEKMRRLFQAHGKKTIFAVKSTTGLCWITFIAAGTFKMKFKDFVLTSFFGGIVWSTFLVIIGYFFGYAFGVINDYIRVAGLIIFAAAAGFYASIILYKRYRSRKILENEK